MMRSHMMSIRRRSLCFALVIGMIVPLAGLAGARSDWRGGGVLDRVYEGEDKVEISGKMYAIASDLKMRGPNGEHLTWLQLGEYQSELVLYGTRYGRPLPIVTEILVEAPSSDPDVGLTED